MRECKDCIFFEINEDLEALHICGHPFLDTSSVSGKQEACDDFIDRKPIEEARMFQDANNVQLGIFGNSR